MKKALYKTIFISLFTVLTTSVYGQQVNSQYFLENVPTRHYLNPAFQPTSNVYVSLPGLGYTQFGFSNNSLSLKDVIYKDANGNPILFLNPNGGNKDKFYRKLRKNTIFRTDLQMNLLGFGFRTNDAYWTFGLSAKVDGQLSMPKDFFKLALYGTPEIQDNMYDLKHFGLDASAYLEAALGYSRPINDQWTVGGKVKFLWGIANISTRNEQLMLNAGINQWNIQGKGMLNISSPLPIDIDSENQIETGDFYFSDALKPSGLGAGIDLGATYKPLDELTISVAVTDLGFIRWRNNPVNISYDINYPFDGFLQDASSISLDGISVDDMIGGLTDSIKYDMQGRNAYTTGTTAKLNIGGEYAFLDNKLSAGLLSRTMFHKSRVYEEITISAIARPADWANFVLSYSILNGRSSFGLGIGLRSGPINWHFSADYLTFGYAGYPISEGGFKVPVPYNTKGLNFAMGINLVFGNKKDKDHDGVPDKLDLCPDTPRKVKVDANGCPIDTDHDGVPDYLDNCPNTPREAYGHVDEHGCPLDSDGDGVPDYLDECPDTPKEAYSKIDEHGCPIDSDGDGVPDYKDICPDTPQEAYGHVDDYGCLLDSDGDGVPDYLDKCPDTPAEGYSTVDANGCPADSDGDGVPDYMDKCPDTPKEAYEYVDENGCPYDTDGDGVPDYMDECPKIPGTVANKGCPEVKKEVRNLFQKALQGIQFETGKATIKKSSYALLNDIAKVMKENPTYMIEIQGHTDNTGSKKVNQELSEKRAEAVKTYLVGKGVNANRIKAVGYGDEKPVASNATAAGRNKNRRVEFIVSFEEVTYE